jgi:selenocysteine lyase/cysteine desulfurase
MLFYFRSLLIRPSNSGAAMNLSRREAITALGLLPAFASPVVAQGLKIPSVLPDRDNFPLDGTYLDAAYVHPFGRMAAAAAAAYLDVRQSDPQGIRPGRNARDLATERFARLINASPEDVAVVPSTLEAENLVNAGLGIGPGAGVVTDGGHYDGSLALYGELHRRGAPLGVVRPREGRIELADVRALLTRHTRLVAVSLVSSTSGFTFDLAELCSLAHAHGALVYADVIQAAGAIPIDVKASGVDFAGCGTYKWLMGDFGTAFLYVRPDRLDRLKRVQVGWRQMRSYSSHALPFESPGPALGTYELSGGASGLFEVSTPAWGPLATVAASLQYVAAVGVDSIARYRQPMLDRLRSKLPGTGFMPLTASGSSSPLICFACRDAKKRFAGPLQQEKIRISLYEHRIRVSPSVYNTMDHIDHLIEILCDPRLALS